MNISHIAVIGAGLMGHGIAQVFARAGLKVNLYDTDESRLASVIQKVEEICHLLEQSTDCVKHISLHHDLASAVAGVQLVIEAGPEKLAIKQQIFEEVEKHVSENTLLATNTSVIPIKDIGQHLQFKQRLVGTHFWNPPYLIPLVEVVQAEATDVENVNIVITVLNQVGMSPVHCKKDVPGFIGNRLQHALKREAIALVANGICDAEAVDTVTKQGFGARLAVVGPLEQSDYLGLELTYNIHKVLIPHLDNTATVHPYLEQLVNEGKTGMAKGQGFRKWPSDATKKLKSKLDKFMFESSKKT